MLIKYGDAKILKIVYEDELNVSEKKVKKALDKSKKTMKTKEVLVNK